jgi:hypothetical protein
MGTNTSLFCCRGVLWESGSAGLGVLIYRLQLAPILTDGLWACGQKLAMQGGEIGIISEINMLYRLSDLTSLGRY